MTILDRTVGGRAVVESSSTLTPTAAGDIAFTVTMDDIASVSYRLNVETNPHADFDPGNPGGLESNGNEVGGTLFGVGAAGTVDVTVRAAGN